MLVPAAVPLLDEPPRLRPLDPRSFVCLVLSVAWAVGVVVPLGSERPAPTAAGEGRSSRLVCDLRERSPRPARPLVTLPRRAEPSLGSDVEGAEGGGAAGAVGSAMIAVREAVGNIEDSMVAGIVPRAGNPATGVTGAMMLFEYRRCLMSMCVLIS